MSYIHFIITFYRLQITDYRLQITVYSLQFTVYSLQFTLSSNLLMSSTLSYLLSRFYKNWSASKKKAFTKSSTKWADDLGKAQIEKVRLFQVNRRSA